MPGKIRSRFFAPAAAHVILDLAIVRCLPSTGGAGHCAGVALWALPGLAGGACRCRAACLSGLPELGWRSLARHVVLVLSTPPVPGDGGIHRRTAASPHLRSGSGRIAATHQLFDHKAGEVTVSAVSAALHSTGSGIKGVSGSTPYPFSWVSTSSTSARIAFSNFLGSFSAAT